MSKKGAGGWGWGGGGGGGGGSQMSKKEGRAGEGFKACSRPVQGLFKACSHSRRRLRLNLTHQLPVGLHALT